MDNNFYFTIDYSGDECELEDPHHMSWVSHRQEFLKYVISLSPVDQRAKMAKLVLTAKFKDFFDDIIYDID